MLRPRPAVPGARSFEQRSGLGWSANAHAMLVDDQQATADIVVSKAGQGPNDGVHEHGNWSPSRDSHHGNAMVASQGERDDVGEVDVPAHKKAGGTLRLGEHLAIVGATEADVARVHRVKAACYEDCADRAR